MTISKMYGTAVIKFNVYLTSNPHEEFDQRKN